MKFGSKGVENLYEHTQYDGKTLSYHIFKWPDIVCSDSLRIRGHCLFPTYAKPRENNMKEIV